MSEEHGGPRPEPEIEGGQDFYACRHDNPYPEGHPYRPRWKAGYERARDREAAWRDRQARKGL